MKHYLAVVLAALVCTSTALAQSQASQQVTVTVQEIAVIGVQGNVTMTISQATPGESPDPITATSTFSVTTNGEDKKITGELDDDMPQGLTLWTTLQAPAQGTSKGEQVLSASAVELVDGITRISGTGLTITYKAQATVEVEPDSYARTVTYTITDN